MFICFEIRNITMFLQEVSQAVQEVLQRAAAIVFVYDDSPMSWRVVPDSDPGPRERSSTGAAGLTADGEVAKLKQRFAEAVSSAHSVSRTYISILNRGRRLDLFLKPKRPQMS